MIHVNADVSVIEFCKEGWQAPVNGYKVLQTGFFRYFCLLRLSIFTQRYDTDTQILFLHV